MTNRASKILTEVITRPHLNFIQTWQDEVSIDTNLWTLTNPVTGTAWQVSNFFGASENAAIAIPNASENARLVAVHRWATPIATANQRLRRIWKKLSLEFRLSISVVSRVNNTTTIFGLTTDPADVRGAAASGLIGWGFAADALQTITTQDGGTEQTNTGFGEDATDMRLKFEIRRNRVDFFLNESLVAQHSNEDLLPADRLYPNFYLATDAGGLCQVSVGTVRLWDEDFES